MIKESITYEDWDENQVTEVLHFNITKTELADNLQLKDTLENLSKRLQVPHELTVSEVQEILDIVKTFMRIAYGERSADGKRFAKSDLIWESFTQTAAYDAFLSSLFEQPEKAVSFLINVMPKEFRDEANEVVSRLSDDVIPGIDGHDRNAEEVIKPAPALETAVAAAPKKFDEYTRQELLDMDDSQFTKLVGTDPGKMTQQQLQVAFQRKAS